VKLLRSSWNQTNRPKKKPNKKKSLNQAAHKSQPARPWDIPILPANIIAAALRRNYGRKMKAHQDPISSRMAAKLSVCDGATLSDPALAIDPT
jgi:hypothetical protein